MYGILSITSKILVFLPFNSSQFHFEKDRIELMRFFFGIEFFLFFFASFYFVQNFSLQIHATPIDAGNEKLHFYFR